jgi:membrane protease YdiL (CAAX protease family)
VPLSFTAGICEEILFRGYLIWMLTPWLGLLGAAAVSAVMFGLAHGYQGGKFGPRAFYAGFVMTAFVLATGSIIPGMVLHALVDLVGGYAAYMALRDTPANDGVANAARSA